MRQLTFHWSGDVPSSGEALPNGRYVVSLPRIGVATNTGLLTCPAPNPTLLGVRLADDGVTVAGAGYFDDQAWEWTDRWTDHGLAFGPKALVYRGNTLLVVPQSAAGPVGYRYVTADGTVVTAAESYADPGRGLYEYTDFGDVAIGQGDDEAVGGGVVMRFADDGILRRLAYADLRDRGPLRDVTVRRAVDDFAIVAVDYGAHVTTITWCSLAELRALPPVAAVVPEPIPEPKPMPDRDHGALVQQIASRLTHQKTLAYAWLLTKHVAWALRGENCGLLQKGPGGENEMQEGGTWYSASRVCYPDGHIFKVVSDAGPDGANGPQWADNDTVAPSRYRPALNPVGGGVDPIDPPDPTEPEPVDLSAVWAAIRELQAKAEAPRRVAIKSSRGRYLRDDWGTDAAQFDRDEAGDGETYTLEEK